MRTLGKFILGTAVAGSALVAIPAQAQSYDRYDNGRYDQRYDDRRYDPRYDDRRYDGRWDDRGQSRAIAVQIQDLERRVARNDGRDRISEREAALLRRDVYNLRAQYRDYSRNGLTQREAQILQSRIQQVRQRLSYERRDRDGRRW